MNTCVQRMTADTINKSTGGFTIAGKHYVPKYKFRFLFCLFYAGKFSFLCWVVVLTIVEVAARFLNTSCIFP